MPLTPGGLRTPPTIEELTAAQVITADLIATWPMGLPCWMAEGRIVLVNPTARRRFRWEGPQSQAMSSAEETSRVPWRWNYRSPSRPFSSGETGTAADVPCSFGEPPRATLRIVLTER